MITVVSLGGSIVAPGAPDSGFLTLFSEMVRDWLAEDLSRKLILVTGGGGPARMYQKAYQAVCKENTASEEADWIGIMATRLNAQLLRAVFAPLCPQPVVYDPTKVTEFVGRIMLAAGWKPGFSTDNDAVLLAERFAVKTVINISNIDKVYTDDPRVNLDAEPIDEICWSDFRAMVGDDWTPGKNIPFDPIASKRAQLAGINVICIGAKDIANIRNVFDEKPFFGTRIF